MLKVIEFPQGKAQDINQMVPIEARKYIPVPITEVSLDWWVIPNKELPEAEDGAESAGTTPVTPKIEALIVAVHNGTIKKFQDIAALAELDAHTYEVETFSAIRALLSRDIATTVIIDIGAATTKLSIIDYGIVKVSHTINRGSQDITVALSTSLGISFEQAEQLKRRDGLEAPQGAVVGIQSQSTQETSTVASSVLEYIFYESDRVIADFQKRYSRLAKKIILIGGGALLRGLLPVAKKKFNTEVLLGESFKNVEAPAFLADVLREAGPEFSMAIGLALRELESSPRSR
jgi:type IV pilus assembly protein PilM